MSTLTLAYSAYYAAMNLCISMEKVHALAYKEHFLSFTNVFLKVVLTVRRLRVIAVFIESPLQNVLLQLNYEVVYLASIFVQALFPWSSVHVC